MLRLCSRQRLLGYSRTRRLYSSAIVAASLDNQTTPPPLPRMKEAKPFSAFLTDKFNRKHTYLRISITERCNLRCTYCMPEEGIDLTPTDKLLSKEEILYLARLFVQEGVTKIRLTGGEPTVRKDIVEIIERLGELRSLGLKEIAMTSNGVSVWRKLETMQRGGLTHLNLSLDSLDPFKYQIMTRSNGHSAVMKTIQEALRLGIKPLKINCVVIKGLNDHEIVDFVEMTKNSAVDVRFIEYMPFEGNKWVMHKMVSYKDMLVMIREKYPTLTRLSDAPDDTSKAWRVPGFAGSIGFITSMTENFCSTCSRLRITADGNLKVCLFGNTEVSLRDVLRSGVSEEDILSVIGLAVSRKKKEHAGLGVLERMTMRPMISIGASSLKPAYLSLKHGAQSVRLYSTKSTKQHSLTHVKEDGSVDMVNVGGKPNTHRTAVATGRIYFTNSAVLTSLLSKTLTKGDALAVAQIAGVMAAKKCADLIPLCHNILLSKVSLSFKPSEGTDDTYLEATSIVECTGHTGVEMEAMTAVSVALLTIYDMCKAGDRRMIIRDVKILKKTGGQSGDWDFT